MFVNMEVCTLSKIDVITAWVLNQVDCPYVYGGTGKECSVAYRMQQADQYSNSATLIKTYCQRMNGQKNTCLGCKWYDEEKKKGKPCYDCAQLTKLAMKQVGISIPSGATSQWKKTNWQERGTISTMPKNKQCLQYRQDADGTMAHTGIHLEDNSVVDARQTKDGVLHGSMESYGRWTHWGIPVGLYDSKTKEGEKCCMTGKVINGNLKMRDSASTKGGVICSMPNGTSITIQEDQGDWAKVAYLNHVGYAMTKYIQFDRDDSIQTESGTTFDVIIPCVSEETRKLILELQHNAK